MSRAPHCWQWSPKNVSLPHAAHFMVRPCPQFEHATQLSLTGERHLGHLKSPSGFHLPHSGHASESGGTS